MQIFPAVRATFLGAAFFASAASAAPTRINFDTDPNGVAIPNGTAVNNSYASLGVTFARDGGGTCGPNIYASNDQPSGFGTAPNVVTPCAPPAAADINESSYGVIKVQLDRPATRVCIDVRPDGASHFASLRVYGDGDGLLASASSTPGLTQQLCVSSLGIRFARFSGGSSSAFARFDNLVVHFGGNPAVQAPFFEALIAVADPLCSSANGGSFTTGTRTWFWNTPTGGATTTRVDALNGVRLGSPLSYAATAGTGFQDYATFGASGLGHYPFTYTMQLATTAGDSVVSMSAMAIHCVADGPAGTSVWVAMPPPALENPAVSSYQSGIGLVSGWSCVGPYVSISFDGLTPIAMPYGSGRADTAPVCGSSNTFTGFGLLSNFNLFGNGTHTAQLLVNGQAFGTPASFQVTAPSGEFLSGVSATANVTNFPAAGRTATLIWQQSQQNFAIHSVTP